MSWQQWLVWAVPLVVSLFTLYRVELRGPKLTLDLLDAPTRWAVQGWRYEGNVVYQIRSGDELPSEDTILKIQISGNVTASIRNDGPRSGVLWDLSFRVDNPPTLFTFWANNMLPEAEPLPVKGKETRGFAPQLIFEVDQVQGATILRELQRSSEDLKLVASYKANRGPFGRPRAAPQATTTLSRKAVIEAITKWPKDMTAL